MITLPGTVSPKTVSERLDLSFGIFARRGEKYSCCTAGLKLVPRAGRVSGGATHAVVGHAGYGLLLLLTRFQAALEHRTRAFLVSV